MRKIRVFAYILVFVMFSVPFWGAPHSFVDSDTTFPLNYKDSILSVRIDSTQTNLDSIPKDTIPKKKSVLDAVVEYSSNDSIVLTAGNWGHLYGEGQVKYSEINLKAEKISMNMDSSIVSATFGVDSLDNEFGYPVFTDNGTDYESKLMKYNFKTKKGYSQGMITKQGEGLVLADVTKKTEDGAMFMKGGCYTTCDHHDHPHFYIAISKGKIRPGKNVVSGPAYLVIEDVPIPFLGLPFAYFPFSGKYSSGIIMPTYGDDMERGFALRDGGYYFAINDYVDLALRGEIYTKGSWGVNAQSSYRKRYKHSGSVQLNYIVTKTGEKEVPATYTSSKDFSINWTHQQDPKVNMFRTLSANVSFSTSSYNHNQLDSRLDINDYTNSNKSSTVNLSQRFPNSPWSVNGSVTVNQTSRDTMVQLTLPSLQVQMSRIYPFKRKEVIGKERWYEKIYTSYSGTLENRIRAKEYDLLKSSFQKDWEHYASHSIPIGASFNAGNFNISPSITYNEDWLTEKSRQAWDGQSHVKVDTTYGFYRTYRFQTSLSVQTKLYGMYKPLFVKGVDIRHVFTPSVSFAYSPDFADPFFNFYDTYQYYDGNGKLKDHTYSPYSKVPGRGKTGSVNFTFDNNLEMKIQRPDTIKKISLIDNFRVGFGYNMMADSMKWSDINASIRVKLSKSLTINLSGVFDTYTYDANGTRINKLRISNGKGLGRLRGVGYSFSPSINQDTFKKWFGGGDDKDKKDTDKNKGDNSSNLLANDDGEEVTEESTQRGSLLQKRKDDGEYDADGYLKNELKWSLSASYSFNYAYGEFDKVQREYKYKLTHSLSFNGNIQPTKNWSINGGGSYDFDAKKVAGMNINITRNLHCWSLSANINSYGNRQTYYISLRANSSLLRDLKYENRGRATNYDPVWD